MLVRPPGGPGGLGVRGLRRRRRRLRPRGRLGGGRLHRRRRGLARLARRHRLRRGADRRRRRRRRGRGDLGHARGGLRRRRRPHGGQQLGQAGRQPLGGAVGGLDARLAGLLLLLGCAEDDLLQARLLEDHREFVVVEEV